MDLGDTIRMFHQVQSYHLYQYWHYSCVCCKLTCYQNGGGNCGYSPRENMKPDHWYLGFLPWTYKYVETYAWCPTKWSNIEEIDGCPEEFTFSQSVCFLINKQESLDKMLVCGLRIIMLNTIARRLWEWMVPGWHILIESPPGRQVRGRRLVCTRVEICWHSKCSWGL